MEENKDVQDNKVYAILAYLGILFLIPLFVAKESPFAKFHTNQGIILFIIEVVLYVITLIVPILGILTGLLSIGVLILAIIGIINAAKGEMKELPIVGKYKILN